MSAIEISNASFISRGFRRDARFIKNTLTLSLRLKYSGKTRLNPLLMKLALLMWSGA
jgi:hypothetical protein